MRFMMYSVEDVLRKLRARARPSQLEGMARYGIAVEKRLGVSIPDLRKIAKEIGQNHRLAVELWQTGIDDARILASMIDEPKKVTEEQMEKWVLDFNSWDVCDQVCMNLFEKTPLAWKKIHDWSLREEEFVKRAAFALIACLAWHDKWSEDQKFAKLFPVIKSASTDERNFVKKAVSWALRNIGKRTPYLNTQAIKVARELLQNDSKASRWIGKNTIRELESEPVQRRLKTKSHP